MKTCYFCKGPVAPSVVDYMATKGGKYVLISRLPVDKCTQCGEVYLDAEASTRVDDAMSRAGSTTQRLDVPVVSYT